MFCQKCGAEINDEAVVCVNCGCAVKVAFNRNKSDTLTDEIMEISGLTTTPLVLNIISLILLVTYCASVLGLIGGFVGFVLSMIALAKVRNITYELDSIEVEENNAYVQKIRKDIKTGKIMGIIGIAVHGVLFTLMFILVAIAIAYAVMGA